MENIVSAAKTDVFRVRINPEIKQELESVYAKNGLTPVSYTHLDVYKRQVHDVDKDGTTYTQPMNWDVYGVIALDDLLAGSTDFTPLNFAE